ncbi:MAG: macro domain-containing protein [Alphaproteobacteria bacterium]|nr:macro domain-containing protein [Alphaproteobacteria bacterium]
MLFGAIIGDIAGSMYEGKRHEIYDDVQFFGEYCRFTDDTVMTCAIAQAIIDHKTKGVALADAAVANMQAFVRKYNHRGYGKQFVQWIYSDDPQPYDSWGNGGPMRVSPCAWAANTLDAALDMARTVTAVTHNHPEALKGSAALVSAIFLARTGASKDEIRQHIIDNYYPMDFTLATISGEWRYGCSSQVTVPFALQSFFESETFEDSIRKAIFIGGDTDTVASMAGAIAGAFYGSPAEHISKLDGFLTVHLARVTHTFRQMFSQTQPDTRFQVIVGDITKTPADAIVNAANESLLGGGGVDGAIHRAAGPELLAECRTLGGCPTGQAKMTKAYNLPAKFVIHAVGPDYTEWEPETAEALLTDTYTSIMQIVAQNPEITTIAIPAISCGIFAFPLERATEIAINTIKSKMPSHLKQVQFVVSNNNIASVYLNLI